MLAVKVELRLLNGIKLVGKVVMVLNGLMMVIGGEEGLPGEVMLEAGGNVGVLHAVMMVLAGIVTDEVGMMHVGVKSKVVGFI